MTSSSRGRSGEAHGNRDGRDSGTLAGYFRISPEFQHRVLFWGILGALLMRGLFIVAGTALSFHGVIYLFGGLLLVTGVKLLRKPTGAFQPEGNGVVRFLARRLPVSRNGHAGRFVVLIAIGAKIMARHMM